MKNNQLKVKNNIPEIKNTLEGIIRRLDEAEDRISKLGDKREISIREAKRKNN